MINNFENLVYLRTLLNIEGIGPQKIFSLLAKFKNIQTALNSSGTQLIQVEGINFKLAKKIQASLNTIDKNKTDLEIEIEKLNKIGGRLISFWDAEYPDLLKKIYYPPLLIYVLGKFEKSDEQSIAVVGTRQPSSYGKLITENLTSQLAQKNLTIVSGLARGIDSVAHESALKVGGRTIGVIGSGLDVIYPPENRRLFNQIKEQGVIISEFELGTKPDAQNFPRRNRIISGIALGTLVVETKINGGAMQTAAYALDQNREIFAVPGNINIKQSEGPNSLIQRGEAKLILSVDDILQELKLKLNNGFSKKITKPSVQLNLFEDKILEILKSEPMQIDDLATAASLSISDCLVNLLTLEFKGLVKQLPGKMFIRV